MFVVVVGCCSVAAVFVDACGFEGVIAVGGTVVMVVGNGGFNGLCAWV